MISQERLIEIVKQLPEVHLELLELVWQLTGNDGQLDPEKLAFRYPELEEAIARAEAYSRETREMVRCLTQLVH